MALFIVLVVALILILVTGAIVYSTRIEKRIAESRTGQVELELALTSAGSASLMKILEDWRDDQDQGTTDAASGGGSNTSTTATSTSGSTGTTTTSGSSTAGTDMLSGGTTSGLDSRHERWAHEYTEELNGVTVEVHIRDGEARLDLNHLFEYAVPIAAGDSGDTPPSPEENSNPTGGGAQNPPPTGGSGGETDQDGDGDPAGDEEEGEDEEEEWQPPTAEQEEAAREMLSRAIEAVIAYNQDHDFPYDNTPNPAAAADAIVRYLLDRYRLEETRRIHDVDALRKLPEVTWELFDGPRDPKEAEREGEDIDEEDAESGSERSSTPDLLNEIFGDLGFDFSGYEEVEDGLEEIPQPLGLRDLLTAHSSGRLNLNTARPELVVGLLLSFDDFDVALDLAYEMQDYLDSKQSDEDEEEDEGSEGDPASGGSGSSGATETEEEEETQEFNVFATLDDLAKVNEEWEAELPNQEETILARLKRDLAKVGFRSEYFTTRLRGKHKGQEQAAEQVLHRDTRHDKIRVLAWKLLPR